GRAFERDGDVELGGKHGGRGTVGATRSVDQPAQWPVECRSQCVRGARCREVEGETAWHHIVVPQSGELLCRQRRSPDKENVPRAAVDEKAREEPAKLAEASGDDIYKVWRDRGLDPCRHRANQPRDLKCSFLHSELLF